MPRSFDSDADHDVSTLQASAPLAVALTAFLAGCASSGKSCGGRVDLQNIWVALAAKHDKDGDGRITSAEFTRGEAQFRNHDRNQDGVISSADYPAGRFWNGFGPWVARSADSDQNKIVERSEWRQMTARLDANGDGIIDSAEFAKTRFKVGADKMDLLELSFDQDGDGRIEVSDFDSLFADLDLNDDGKLAEREFKGSERLFSRPKSKLPVVGQMAPDFDLPRSDDASKTVKLSSFRGKRPVALIFGSYT